MKSMKKILAFALVLVMLTALGATAFASDTEPAPSAAPATDGSIKVTNATKGQTYEAFLVFPASVSDANDLSAGVTYTATSTQAAISGFDTYFDKIVDEDGNYTISKKSSASNDDVISWIKSNIDSLKQGSAISGTVADDDTVTFSNLAYGYYYITSTLGTLVTIDTAGKNVSVVDKNESTPTGPDKEITGEDNAIDESLDQTGVKLTENATSVGSVETFTVTFNATNWVQAEETNNAGTGVASAKKKALVWHFKDTPVGLAIDADSVSVKVNGTQDITSTIKNKAVDATTGVLTFDIPWVTDDTDQNFLYETKTSGSALIPVTVTYTATVTAAAATAPAPNTVDVKYDRTGEQNVDLGDDTTTTYTYKFLLKKTDENDNALEGAEFQLFFGEQEEPLTFTMNEGKYQYDPSGEVTNIAPTGDPATAEIIGLDNASYTLKEVVVPAGYNKAADTPVSNLVKEDGESEASATTITVKNEKGTELPSTGGIGTTLFYVFGTILVLGAGVVLVTKRRVKE